MADGGFLRDHQSFIGKKEGPYGMQTQMGLCQPFVTQKRFGRRDRQPEFVIFVKGAHLPGFGVRAWLLLDCTRRSITAAVLDVHRELVAGSEGICQYNSHHGMVV